MEMVFEKKKLNSRDNYLCVIITLSPPSCFECEGPSPPSLAFDLAFVIGSSVGNPPLDLCCNVTPLHLLAFAPAGQRTSVLHAAHETASLYTAKESRGALPSPANASEC